MSKRMRSSAQWKQRFFHKAPWRPHAAMGLPAQSSESQGAGAPFNPFAVAQGGPHSLVPFSLPPSLSDPSLLLFPISQALRPSSSNPKACFLVEWPRNLHYASERTSHG
jgi:hypothetical protein